MDMKNLTYKFLNTVQATNKLMGRRLRDAARAKLF